MDLDDTPEEAAFRQRAREWIDANAPADWRSLDLRSRDDTGLDVSKDWQRRKYDAGWACIHWPKAYGGQDATPIDRVIWAQEEGDLGLLSSVFVIGQGMCAPTIMTHGSESLKQRHLARIASGEEIWCQLFSEPGGGSDLAGLRTRAEAEGDHWVINGQKIWTSGAHYSDHAILLVRTDATVRKHRGLTMFCLDMRTPGITVKPIKQISGNSDFNEVYFDDVRIPDAHRLGAIGEGWGVALTTLMNERLEVGGVFPTNFEDMFAFARRVEGTDGPAIREATVRERLADWYVRSAGLRNIQHRMMSALSRGETPGPEASISKLILGINRQRMASYMLDIQDMFGVVVDPERGMDEGQFHTVFLRAAAHRIEGGTDEILRNIIAERVLDLPGDVRVDKAVPFNEIPDGRE